MTNSVKRPVIQSSRESEIDRRIDDLIGRLVGGDVNDEDRVELGQLNAERLSMLRPALSPNVAARLKRSYGSRW